MELAPFPDFIIEKGMYTRFSKGVGIEIIQILEFDDSKYAEANEYIGKRILAFSKVPGFSCSVQPWLTIEEALTLMG